MAKQRVVVTKVTRTYRTTAKGSTVNHSSPAGKTSIGGSSHKGNPHRCPTCGRYLGK